MSEKLIIGKPEFHCPVCNTEWFKSDLEFLDSIGCPGCKRNFDLQMYMYEGEPFWTDWREKCYDRMIQENEKHSAI